MFRRKFGQSTLVATTSARSTAQTPLWGYAGHPLVDGNQLICVVGGEGSYVVAFDKNSGEEALEESRLAEQGYAPPSILEIAGQRQLVLFRPDAVTSLDPESGSDPVCAL